MKLVQVKIEDANNGMPWYWMVLLSHKYPGQFYYKNTTGAYVVFSGVGMPDDLSKIPEIFEKYMQTQGCIGPKIYNASTINRVPDDAQPLYLEVYQEAINNMQNARGRTLQTAQGIERIIQYRFNKLNRQKQTNQALVESGAIFALENTASFYYGMGNTVSHGDLGRASNYISSVLLRETTTENSQEIPVLKDENKSDKFQMFSFTPKNTANLKNDLGATKLAAEELVAEIIKRTGRVVLMEIKATENRINLVIESSPSTERDRMVFLEEVRVGLYASGLDNKYELKWTHSTKTFVPAIDPDLTDDEEESVLMNITAKVRHEKPELKDVTGDSWIKNKQRQRALIMPKGSEQKATLFATTLKEKGLSVILAETTDKSPAVVVTLRAKRK